jgi:hypothetical protein
MSNTNAKTNLARRIEQLSSDLTAVRDEARLQQHLMALDARDRLDVAEREYEQLQGALRRASDETVESLHQSAGRLKDAYLRLRAEALTAVRGAQDTDPVEPEHAPADPEC